MFASHGYGQGRGAGAHAGIVKAFPVFRGFKSLVELDHIGVVAAELGVRAVAADDDVSLLSTAMDQEEHLPAMECFFLNINSPARLICFVKTLLQ